MKKITRISCAVLVLALAISLLVVVTSAAGNPYVIQVKDYGQSAGVNLPTATDPATTQASKVSNNGSGLYYKLLKNDTTKHDNTNAYFQYVTTFNTNLDNNAEIGYLVVDFDIATENTVP